MSDVIYPPDQWKTGTIRQGGPGDAPLEGFNPATGAALRAALRPTINNSTPRARRCRLPKLGELLRDVFPPGVLNVVAGGEELGQWMSEHPNIVLDDVDPEAVAKKLYFAAL